MREILLRKETCMIRKGASMMRREFNYGKGSFMMRREFDYGKGTSMMRRRDFYYEKEVGKELLC